MASCLIARSSFSRREFRNREAVRQHGRKEPFQDSFSRREFRNREADMDCQCPTGVVRLQSARIQES